MTSIRQATDADNNALTGVFNSCVKNVPLCSELSIEEFVACLELSREITNPWDCKNVRNDAVLVALADDEIVAFADVAIADIGKPPTTENEGLIHFLCYMPGHRRQAQELLDHFEGQAFSEGVRRIRAFHGFSVWRVSLRHARAFGPPLPCAVSSESQLLSVRS